MQNSNDCIRFVFAYVSDSLDNSCKLDCGCLELGPGAVTCRPESDRLRLTTFDVVAWGSGCRTAVEKNVSLTSL